MKRSFDFLGVEVSSTGGDRAYAVPVPIEWSTTYGKGAALAPARILSASLQVELYNGALDVDLEGSGIVTLDPEVTERDALMTFIAANREAFAASLPCFIGGEHSITPWILRALERSGIGIVWLDAHADCRESYLGEKENHACAARNASAFGPIVEVGVRSYSREEREFLRGSDRVRAFHFWDDAAARAIRSLPRSVYLSVDFDALDPSIIRSVGTPEPDGLRWDETMDILSFVFAEKRVIAMDAVELCPTSGDEASNFIAAKLIAEALARYLKEGHRT
jgi:agmatinase